MGAWEALNPFPPPLLRILPKHDSGLQRTMRFFFRGFSARPVCTLREARVGGDGLKIFILFSADTNCSGNGGKKNSFPPAETGLLHLRESVFVNF